MVALSMAENKNAEVIYLVKHGLVPIETDDFNILKRGMRELSDIFKINGPSSIYAALTRVNSGYKHNPIGTLYSIDVVPKDGEILSLESLQTLSSNKRHIHSLDVEGSMSFSTKFFNYNIFQLPKEKIFTEYPHRIAK